MDRKQEIIIQPQQEGLELLSWISERFTYFPRVKWKQYIIEKRVQINHNSIVPKTVLYKGDIVTFNPEPVIEPSIDKDYKVVYEDKDLLVINKPPNLPCHPGGIYFENTLWYILKQEYEYISFINRLDRETSGIMLIAKNKESASFYFNKMRERDIEKEYLLLVHGCLKDIIDARGWLIKDSASSIRKKRKFLPDDNADSEEGNSYREFSHSSFRAIKSDKKYTLLQCKIFTGRTHQIRASISSLGYPVVGDKIYGLDESYFLKFIGDTLSETDRINLVLGNQALHSYKTTVPMLNGKRQVFTISPPDNWPIK